MKRTNIQNHNRATIVTAKMKKKGKKEKISWF